MALTLSYSWGGQVQAQVSPELLGWSCPSDTEYTLSPAELTWDSKEGWGAKSQVQVSTKSYWCQPR